MENIPVKQKILDYIYDIVGYPEVLQAGEKELRAIILNRLPHKIPSYFSSEIAVAADGVDGRNFSNFLFSMGILSAPGQVVEKESFIYLKNKAELQNPGRTLFN